METVSVDCSSAMKSQALGKFWANAARSVPLGSGLSSPAAALDGRNETIDADTLLQPFNRSPECTASSDFQILRKNINPIVATGSLWPPYVEPHQPR